MDGLPRDLSAFHGQSKTTTTIGWMWMDTSANLKTPDPWTESSTILLWGWYVHKYPTDRPTGFVLLLGHSRNFELYVGILSGRRRRHSEASLGWGINIYVFLAVNVIHISLS